MIDSKIGIYLTENELKFIIDLIGTHIIDDEFGTALNTELRDILTLHKNKTKAEQSLPVEELQEQINPYMNIEKNNVSIECKRKHVERRGN